MYTCTAPGTILVCVGPSLMGAGGFPSRDLLYGSLLPIFFHNIKAFYGNFAPHPNFFVFFGRPQKVSTTVQCVHVYRLGTQCLGIWPAHEISRGPMQAHSLYVFATCGGSRDLSNEPSPLFGFRVLVLLRHVHAEHLNANEAMRRGRPGGTGPQTPFGHKG